MIRSILDAPVLVAERRKRILVAADLHLGIEHELRRSGVTIPSQTEKLFNRLLDHMGQTDPDRLLLLGDIRHNIPWISHQEAGEIPKFLGKLARHVPIDIVPGNHDGGMHSLIPSDADITFHPSKGIVMDGVGYFHGHTWPSADVLSVERVLVAHNHPMVRFVDSLGHVSIEPAWILATLDADVLLKRYKSIKTKEVMVMPAFNELCGGTSFNTSTPKTLLGPIFTSGAIGLEEAEVYLLDGTHIGKIKDLRRLGE
ncbi:MAG: metallophosphoesterase [Methanocellales archaeon]|nr:metallophosphoesterase [Methanocellales archaeon]